MAVVIRDWAMGALAGLMRPRAPIAPSSPAPPAPWRIVPAALENMPEADRAAWLHETFKAARPLPGVLPSGMEPASHPMMAMDDSATVMGAIYAEVLNSQFSEGLRWLGYQYLAELAQRAEYRLFTEVHAEEMTRKWIEIEATGEDDKSDAIRKLTEAQDKFDLRLRFKAVAELDGFFGVGHLYIDIDGARDDPEVLASPLILDSRTIKRNSLKGFIPVEPIWTYPGIYNANDPLRPDFYRPQTWYVMGKTVHRSRILTFISRPLPDILKPAYAFGGMSMTQMLMPYVNFWLTDRSSASELLNNFSTMVLKTDMNSVLNAGGAEFLRMRAQIYNSFKNNNGLMFINKGAMNDPGEEMANISVPLTSLPELVAQAQEHMASIGRVPLVKAFGITPSGLTASSDGEIRTFYDSIHADQENDFGPNLKTALDVIQLSEFGSIDKELTHRFIELWQLDEAGIATVEKTEADIDQQYIDMGVLSPDEVRENIARTKESRYAGLDLDSPAPEPLNVDVEGNPINDPTERQINSASVRAGGGGTGGAASGV